MARVSAFISKYFIVIALSIGTIAFLWPETFQWASPHVVLLSSITMFSMGITTDISDFKQLAKQPKHLILGVICVFLVAPISIFILTSLVPIPYEIALGLMLVACCPGGTTSNVFTMLSGGDTPLSIGMTFFETLAATFITPALVLLFCGANTDVDGWGMVLSVLQIVVIPVTAGLFVKTKMPKTAGALLPAVPLISIGSIVCLMGGVVSSNAALLPTIGLSSLIPGMVFIPFCLTVGYFVCKLLRIPLAQRKAVAIEIGFKNVNLAVALAVAHFSELELVTIPCVVIIIMTNILGPCVSLIWKKVV